MKKRRVPPHEPEKRSSRSQVAIERRGLHTYFRPADQASAMFGQRSDARAGEQGHRNKVSRQTGTITGESKISHEQGRAASVVYLG